MKCVQCSPQQHVNQANSNPFFWPVSDASPSSMPLSLFFLLWPRFFLSSPSSPHRRAILCLSLDASSSSLFTGGSDGALQWTDTRSSSLVATLQHPAAAAAAASGEKSTLQFCLLEPLVPTLLVHMRMHGGIRNAGFKCRAVNSGPSPYLRISSPPALSLPSCFSSHLSGPCAGNTATRKRIGRGPC